MSASLDTARAAVEAIDRLYTLGRERIRARVVKNGALDGAALDREQLAAHALAYVATELAACRQLLAWADAFPGPAGAGLAGAESAAIAQVFVAEVARNLRSVVYLGATETYPISEMMVTPADVAETVGAPSIARWADEESSGDRYIALGRAHAAGALAPVGLADETLEMMRAEFKKFVNDRVMPVAQPIHRKDELIPMELIRAMGDMGVFGITIPESYGGQGLGKIAMCVITEELSRGYIGIGSLGTRAEIAAELILHGGTEEQKQKWLPLIASGAVLPTAVFTEPDHGSDLAHLKSRATRADGGWRIDGNKTWITHASRATLMTVLARTDPAKPDHNGLSMLLAEKQTGKEGDEFPDAGLQGTEIKVLGYRGMKEYELSFDGFRVPAEALLGGEGGLGKGFRYLMTTFESARIQTAARGVGVAQAALDEAAKYANQRVQFGKPLVEMARVARKLGRMVVLTHAARQLTFYSANMKDSGKRCDLEAGMAKLLATRAAWECADAGVQIHGGNGYAEEYTASRLLVDARVLSIFEGANEIQAHVIARRLIES
ncbi:MAG TPA: acyl-CoA dehydrogenase family protein [Polyangiaceae bacterium]|nr:acyl-CoA dehydrogenase family protein [Polyangiaceae bacterium]